MPQELKFKVGDKVVYKNKSKILETIRRNRGNKMADKFNDVLYGVVTSVHVYVSNGRQDLILDWVNHKGIVVIPRWFPSTEYLERYKP